jgi:hypothetical protein
MKRLLIAFCLIAIAPAGMAQGRRVCTVTDPTGTPLNVRASPNGAIRGGLYNGVRVYRVQTTTDSQGKDWSYVVPLEGGKEGWVFRNYVSCP